MTDQAPLRAVRLMVTRPLASYKTIQKVGAVEIEDLRVTFDVSASLKKEPNKATIVVYGLAPEARAGMQAKGGKVILQAGYSGAIQQLFIGDIHQITHVHERTGWATKIEATDGGRAFKWARLVESFSGTVSAGSIVRKAAEALGLSLGNALDKAAELATKQAYRSGYAVRGKASDVLSGVLDAAGYEWSVQDGAVQILRPGEAVPGVVVLAPDSGLIDTPMLGTPVKKGGPPVVMCKALLQKFRCGGRVVLETLQFKGVYRVLSCSYTGDTHSTGAMNWCADLEIEATRDAVVVAFD